MSLQIHKYRECEEKRAAALRNTLCPVLQIAVVGCHIYFSSHHMAVVPRAAVHSSQPVYSASWDNETCSDLNTDCLFDQTLSLRSWLVSIRTSTLRLCADAYCSNCLLRLQTSITLGEQTTIHTYQPTTHSFSISRSIAWPYAKRRLPCAQGCHYFISKIQSPPLFSQDL